MVEDQISKKNEDSVHEGLKALRRLPVEPSPYLQSKILASYHEKPSFFQKLRYFGMGALVTGLTAVAIVFYLGHPNSNVMVASEFKVGTPYLLKVNLQNVVQQKVAYVEVEILGDNVQFFSQTISDLSQQAKLIFEWEQLNRKDYLPVVIRGLRKGQGKVKVTFYSSENIKLDDQVMSVHFGENI